MILLDRTRRDMKLRWRYLQQARFARFGTLRRGSVNMSSISVSVPGLVVDFGWFTFTEVVKAVYAYQLAA